MTCLPFAKDQTKGKESPQQGRYEACADVCGSKIAVTERFFTLIIMFLIDFWPPTLLCVKRDVSPPQFFLDWCKPTQIKTETWRFYVISDVLFQIECAKTQSLKNKKVFECTLVITSSVLEQHVRKTCNLSAFHILNTFKPGLCTFAFWELRTLFLNLPSGSGIDACFYRSHLHVGNLIHLSNWWNYY